MPDDKRKPEDLSFEEAMEALDTIVSSLETERLPLEEMVTSYERGVNLLRTCRDRITTAQQRVELITAHSGPRRHAPVAGDVLGKNRCWLELGDRHGLWRPGRGV